MDSNNSMPQAPIINTPPQSPQPVAPQVPIPAPTKSDLVPPGDSHKVILWFVIGLIVVILAVAGVYLFLSRQQAAETTRQPIVQVTPKPADMVNALDQDLNSINVATSDADFSTVDQDLNQL